MGRFMERSEARVFAFYEEGKSAFFAGGFAVEVATKVMTMVDVLLRTNAGMVE